MTNQYAIWIEKLERYCAYQERCTSDVVKKMASLNVDGISQNKLIQELKDSGFIDDRRYALFFLKSKVNTKRDGIQKIVYALKQKKIDAQIISEVLLEIDRDTYTENIELLIQRKWAQISIKNDKKLGIQKLIRYLMSKGYKYDEFNSYIHKLG